MDDIKEPSKYGFTILKALQNKQIYQGSVSWQDKVARRRKNRAAKLARRKNRH